MTGRQLLGQLANWLDAAAREGVDPRPGETGLNYLRRLTERSVLMTVDMYGEDGTEPRIQKAFLDELARTALDRIETEAHDLDGVLAEDPADTARRVAVQDFAAVLIREAQKSVAADPIDPDYAGHVRVYALQTVQLDTGRPCQTKTTDMLKTEIANARVD